MPRTRVLAVMGVMALMLMAASGPATADSTVHARLTAENHSGAGGGATLTATDGGQLTVVVHAYGLMPGPHAQHIHGSAEGGHHMCASMADDTDGDGVLSNEEASGEYGTIFLALTTRGDASTSSGLTLDRMPVADSTGHLDYHRTFPASAVPPGLLEHLAELHIVQHGIDANDNGRYDLQALGVSTFAKGVGLAGIPEEVTDPAACGVVTGAGASISPLGGIETGGGDAGGGGRTPLVALGVVTLAALAGSAVRWRGRHARTAPAER